MINRNFFDRIVHTHRGHKIGAGNDVRGVIIDYRHKRKTWKTANSVKHAIRVIDEAKDNFKQKHSS